MPSGKAHKSKEATWTEKDLTDAIQGEKPRRSRDDGGRRRESRDPDGKRQSAGERHRDERDADRQRSKPEKSRRHQEQSSLEQPRGSRDHSGSRGDRKAKDRATKDRPRDDGARDSGGDRTRDRGRRERNGEEEGRRDRPREDGARDSGGGTRDRGGDRARDRGRREREEGTRDRLRDKSRDDGARDSDGRTRDRGRQDGEGGTRDRPTRGGPSNDDTSRNKERTRKTKGGDDEGKERRHREADVDKAEQRREKESGRRDRDMDPEDRGKRIRDRDGGRRQDGDVEHDDHDDRKRRGERDDRKRDKRSRDQEDDDRKGEDGRREKGGRHRDREDAERHRDKEEGKHERGERKRDKKRDEKRTNKRHEEDGEEERRRAKQERREKRKETGDHELENGNDGTKERERQRDGQESTTSKGKVEVTRKSSSIQNASEVAEEVINGDDYDDNYEDDFEDYEDDFEDDDINDGDDVNDDVDTAPDKGKLLEIFEAINAENDDVARTSPFPRTPNEDSENKTIDKRSTNEPHESSSVGRINFFAAKQRHVTDFVASKTKKRAKELEKLIELDVATYDIFDLPPLNEYELYIKSYGQSDSKQAYVQCHDDIVEKEIQSEEIEMSTKWTQYPPDDFRGCGEVDENGDEDNSQETMLSPHSVNSAKLSNFLQQAGQVCLILLEEMSSGRANLMLKERNDIKISDGFIQLTTRLPFLEGRRIMDVQFNPIQTHLLLTAHDSHGSKDNDRLRGKGVVCFWNVNEPTQPQKILFCESSPRSCCFSPIKSSLVFAGLEDGSIVTWDLRESSSLHMTKKDDDQHWVFRRPTFSTASVIDNENHLGSVQTVHPISLPRESAEASIHASFVQDEPSGMAFQLASLDENGLVNIWVVIELDKPDEAGSELDLGLAPGGRIKLVKSTSIKVASPYRDVFTGCNLQTTEMQFSTEDPNHFYVSSDRGWVVHCTRYGGRTHPKAYRPDTDSFVTVTAMDVSPWSIPIILVGCADGSLRLHDLRKEYAVRSWPESTQGNQITQIKWSRSRPSIFYVLDTKSNLYIWDLLQNERCATSTEHFNRARLLLFSISNDYESLGIGLPGRKSELVLNYEGGIVELHKLKQNFITIQPDDLDRFASLVDSFI